MEEKTNDQKDSRGPSGRQRPDDGAGCGRHLHPSGGGNLVSTVSAANAENVEYVNASGTAQSPVIATVVETATTAWNAEANDGWYVVDQSLTISHRVVVSGDVKLILSDGCTLTASEGITVSTGNSLTIYCQDEGTGALVATGMMSVAGIGGGFSNDQVDCGTITINGGSITATSMMAGAGIGGSSGGAGGTVIINGGNVTATGNMLGAGIGGGSGGIGGNITINGGTVVANGRGGGAGIGGGSGACGGSVLITGGTVTATSRLPAGSGGIGMNYGDGIGNGYGYSGTDSPSFSTSQNGNAVIFASASGESMQAIRDLPGQNAWSGVFFLDDETNEENNGNGTVYGSSVMPSSDFSVPEDTTLFVSDGKTLDLTHVQVTNNGIVDATGGNLIGRNNIIGGIVLPEETTPPEEETPAAELSDLEKAVSVYEQLKEQGAEDKFYEVLEEVPRVRKDLGEPPLVTPSSQIVGTQAVFNVLMGERYKMATKETKDILSGKYGATVKPFNKEVQKKILGENAEIITCRPADLIPNELDTLRKECERWIQQDEDVLTYALFPQVAVEFFKYREAQQTKVDVSVADTENGAYPV